MSKDFEIKPEEYFRLGNGRILKNLNELLNALKSMNEETLKFHVNEQKNDFGNWVKYVFKDEELTNSIFNSKTKEDIIKAIEAKLFIEEEKEEGTKLGSSRKPEPKKLVKTFPFVKTFPKTSSRKPVLQNNIKFSKQKDFPLEKMEEILMKEKEIGKREEKIEEIEARIEEELSELAAKKEPKFFSKEFVQGLVTGLLVTLIIILIYIKFYY